MHAYNEMYVGDAQDNLAALFDWGCNDLGIPLATLFSIFASSSLGARFGKGDPAIVAGKSGPEIGFELLAPRGLIPDDYPLAQVELDFLSRSPEYWAGWVLAFFQWEEGASFKQIDDLVDADDVVALYVPYHEMDISQACDAIACLMCRERRGTNLKKVRTAAGLSQSDLARLSGVSVRTIQHYEQRQKSINKASAETVLQLSSCLCCQPQDLMEPLSQERYGYALTRF